MVPGSGSGQVKSNGTSVILTKGSGTIRNKKK